MQLKTSNKKVYPDRYAFSAIHDKYLYRTGQKDYIPIQSQPTSPSIDSLLDQDSHTLLDKVVNTACSIVYRLRIYRDVNAELDYSWLRTKNELLELQSSFYRGANMNVERRKSMLTKELLQLDKQKLEQKVECWKDLNEPVSYLVNSFHQNQELKQDRKMLK